MFNRDFGVVNQILGAFGIPAVSWLGSTAWAMPSIILIGTWAFGTSMVIVLAGLQAVPEHLYEAAAVDGANAWRRFRHVTVPQLSPTLFFLTVVGDHRIVSGLHHGIHRHARRSGIRNPLLRASLVLQVVSGLELRVRVRVGMDPVPDHYDLDPDSDVGRPSVGVLRRRGRVLRSRDRPD